MYTKRTFKPTAFDHLESREVLSMMGFGGVHTIFVQPHATLAGVLKGNTMKNVSQDLNMVYNAFVSNGGNVTLIAAQFPNLRFQGNSVSVMVKGKGDFNTLLRDVQNSGMTVSTSSAFYDVVVGYVPISSLPTIANLPETGSISPNYRPILSRFSGHTFGHALGGAMIAVHHG